MASIYPISDRKKTYHEATSNSILTQLLILLLFNAILVRKSGISSQACPQKGSTHVADKLVVELAARAA